MRYSSRRLAAKLILVMLLAMIQLASASQARYEEIEAAVQIFQKPSIEQLRKFRTEITQLQLNWKNGKQTAKKNRLKASFRELSSKIADQINQKNQVKSKSSSLSQAQIRLRESPDFKTFSTVTGVESGGARKQRHSKKRKRRRLLQRLLRSSSCALVPETDSELQPARA